MLVLMDALVDGLLLVVAGYLLVQCLVLLGVVVYGSTNPGWLGALATYMDEPPQDVSEREFLLIVATSISVQWPLVLLTYLDSDGRWRG
jgi:hypothetical protein